MSARAASSCGSNTVQVNPELGNNHHMNVLFKIARAVYGDGQEKERKDTYAVISDLLKNRERWGVDSDERPTLHSLANHKQQVLNLYKNRAMKERVERVLRWAEAKIAGDGGGACKQNIDEMVTRFDATRITDKESKVGRRNNNSSQSFSAQNISLTKAQHIDLDIPEGCRKIRITFSCR